MKKIFAYGSLLNKATWPFDVDIELVTVRSWVRQWRQIVQTDRGKICALTISPDIKSSIDGILLAADDQTLSKLIKREIGYNRTEILNSNISKNQNSNKHLLKDESVITFISSKPTFAWATKEAPILLSYIDVVAKGYFDFYGMEGLINFFNTTEGWNLPIMNDRSQPLYPRALKLDPEFLNLVDQQILLHI